MDQATTPRTLDEAAVSGWRAAIEARLVEICAPFGVHSGPLGQAMTDAVTAPGKRFRGTLLLVAGAAAGEVSQPLIDVACAVELAHTASLIFDDLPCMDDATRRRGRPTTHVVHGESRTILAGIGLVTESLRLLATAEGLDDSARARVTEILATAIGPAGLCAGQELDLHAAKTETSIGVEQDLKTGALFAAGFQMLAVIQQLPRNEAEALVQLGMLLGRVFQSYDDLLDALGDEVLLGKDVRRDLQASTPGRGLLAVADLEGAAGHYARLRARLDDALAACPFDALLLEQYTATILPRSAPQAA